VSGGRRAERGAAGCRAAARSAFAPQVCGRARRPRPASWRRSRRRRRRTGEAAAGEWSSDRELQRGERMKREEEA